MIVSRTPLRITLGGGGRFFTFYCNNEHSKLRTTMKEKGLQELEIVIDLIKEYCN